MAEPAAKRQRIAPADKSDSVQDRCIADFCKWVESIGADMSRARIEEAAPGCGLRLLASKPISGEEPAVTVPLSALLTVAAAVRSEIGQALLASKTAAALGKVSARSIVYCVMIDAKASEKSRWHAHCRAFPSEYGDPLWWTKEERETLLAGTQLAYDTVTHESHLRALHTFLFPALSDELPHLFPRERYTYEAFRWARSGVASRCFQDEGLLQSVIVGSKDAVRSADLDALRLTDEEKKRLELDCPAMVIPLIDMGNHEHDKKAHVGLVVDGDKPVGVGVLIEDGVAEGEEIILNYGSCRTNLQFLLGHGFCVPDNPSDAVPLRLGTGVAQGASAARVKIIKEVGMNPQELFELSRQKPLPERLLATLRAFLLPMAAMKKLWKATTVAVEKASERGVALLRTLEKPVPAEFCADADCELEVLNTLMQFLTQKSKAIEAVTTPPHLQGGHAAVHAATYRAGQLSVLAAAKRAIEDAKRAWCVENGITDVIDGDGAEEGEEEEDGEPDEEDIVADNQD
eukprot:TRINITY_DN29426_c0_g1_i3.p1 TRINITY_DN29426_c0_g1~~TRINITY_DN29426_c0_g1_i3.p1  ORF type:complete len:517 (+),score=134.51 TRINITY_DN29426_c0_g1_i3:166-1716(+)